MFNYSNLKDFTTPYIIAEIGANHNGNMELARKLIKAAKDAGAHAAKFQSWNKNSLISREEYERNQTYDDSPKKHFGSLEEMVEKYYLREEQHYELKKYCDEIGIDFCSSPFSPAEVDLLDDVGVPFFKVASCDINNLPLIRHMARKTKPIILSTGMADISEISTAIRLIENEGNNQIVLLHCIAIYPPRTEDIHLNNIPMLANAFGYPVGFSDHSIGSAIPLAAVALGACVIEKHFTLDKNMEGWDHQISADPFELKAICDGSSIIPKALGNHYRRVSQAELEKRAKFRRSIVVKHSKKAGDVITEEDLDFKRPGTAIPPDQVEFVVGRTLKSDLTEDQILRWSDFL